MILHDRILTFLISLLVEPTTAEPVDTMNLGMIPIVVKKEEESEEEEEDEQSDLRLTLFPSQIHKISNLIALLAHQRDLLQRLGEMKEDNANGKIAESLEWRSQMQYLFDTESRIVQAKVCARNNIQTHFLCVHILVILFMWTTMFFSFWIIHSSTDLSIWDQRCEKS